MKSVKVLVFILFAVSTVNTESFAGESVYDQYRQEWKSVLEKQVSSYFDFCRTLKSSGFSVSSVKRFVVVEGNSVQAPKKREKRDTYFSDLVKKLLQRKR